MIQMVEKEVSRGTAIVSTLIVKQPLSNYTLLTIKLLLKPLQTMRSDKSMSTNLGCINYELKWILLFSSVILRISEGSKHNP